jgi:hypothetical protein
MPGIDQRQPNFQSASRAENQAVAKPAISHSSIAAKHLLQANKEKKIEQTLEKQALNENAFVNQQDQKYQNNEIKKQRATQADGFQKNDPSISNKHTTSVSQYATEIKEKKQRQQETQNLAQSINSSQIGQVRAKINNPQAKAPSEEIHTSALVAQAHLDAVDPDSLSQEEKQAYKLLDEISQRGAEKGKAFVAFAKREIGKGRLAEIMDLIEGYHKNLKGDSLTASEMIEAGQERLLTVKNMVSSDNKEELQILNQKIIARSDAPVGFKRDQAILRNLSASERQAPPSFNKTTKPSQIEQTIRFVSTINNAVLKAPWDKLA